MPRRLLNYWARNAEAFLADRHPRPHNPLMMTKRLTTVSPAISGRWLDHPVELPVRERRARRHLRAGRGRRRAAEASEVTPLSAVEFVRGWTEIGAPPVLALTTGYAETGAAVIANFDYVHFTGFDGHRPQGRGGDVRSA